jgi:cytosine/adenosine deaminase-related metal-dependent hydrolase
MLITGASIAIDGTTAIKKDLWLHDGLVSFTPVPDAGNDKLDLEGCLVLPGLINAHDHLEMNLFPRLGAGPYPNASRWAEDIYNPNQSPVKEHLSVPKALRFRWGAIKNVLSGVTTIAHHNDLHSVLFGRRYPARVLRRFNWAHSLRFSTDWLLKFQATPRNWPFIIHAAEGTDESAPSEIQTMAQAGALNASTVLVHCVGIGPLELSLIKKHRSSLIWCPSSNHFTLGRTLGSSVLNSGIPIALGTDSAMTADGDLLDELVVAHRSVPAERLYEMVTSEPARILNLPFGFGRICHGGPADLLVLEDDGKTPATSLLSKYPQLVILKGRTVAASTGFADRHRLERSIDLSTLHLEGRGQYLISANAPRLMRQTKSILDQELRLAGKAIAA